MDEATRERIARLEVRMDNIEATVGSVDKKLDTIIESVGRWQSNQKGFIAGVTFIGSLVWVILTTGWNSITKVFGGHGT